MSIAVSADIPSSPGSDEEASPYWRRNLYVCLLGSFSTVASMTLILPFLPLYVAELGVHSQRAVMQWSGIAFGATFLAAGIASPFWGRFADRYGRKLILVRASLGMAIVISTLGLAQNVYQLVMLRLLAGLVGGYASGSIILVATQTPKSRSGWALGMLSTGVLTGSLVGPLIGGILPELIGVRQPFFLAGGVIFLAFLCTCAFIKEVPRRRYSKAEESSGSMWSKIPNPVPVIAMLATGLLLLFANMSIEPIITVYVSQIMLDSAHVALISGVVMSATAFGGILAAPKLGRLSDKIGAWNVVIGCLLVTSVLVIPQAFVTTEWQLVLLRFLMGMSLAGLLPSITTVIRHNVPNAIAGGILGLSTSSQFAGQVAGPLAGGFIGGHCGMRAVFFATSALMLFGGLGNYIISKSKPGARASAAR
jgi:MFS family permease